MNMSALFKLLLILSCLVVAGPELGVGIELLLLLDLMGVELFLFSFSVPVLFYSRILLAKLQKIDPYFFLSSRKDIVACPALLAHAIPFFIVSLFFVLSSAVFSFLLGD